MAQRKTNRRSSATAEQMARMLAAMRRRNQTTEDFRKLGIFQVSARIKGLRDAGYVIHTHRINLTDRDGYEHSGVGLCELLEEPKEVS